MNSKQEDEWPDWAGQTAVVVATGPSANASLLSLARGKARFIAVKNSFALCHWADILYGVDRAWWIARQGVRHFAGARYSPSPSVCKAYPNVRLVKLRPSKRVIFEPKGTVGGGNSGFQAVNLAAQFGAKQIQLIGFDMRLDQGAHWHDDYRGMERPDAKRVDGWRREMDECANEFKARGIEVVNCTLRSALTQYYKASFAELWH